MGVNYVELFDQVDDFEIPVHNILPGAVTRLQARLQLEAEAAGLKRKAEEELEAAMQQYPANPFYDPQNKCLVLSWFALTHGAKDDRDHPPPTITIQ